MRSWSLGSVDERSTSLWNARRTAIAKSTMSGSFATPSDCSPPPPALPPFGCALSAKRITKKPIMSMTMSAKEMSHSGAPSCSPSAWPPPPP